MLIQTFGTPNMHPKQRPFYDHVFAFSVADNRIWFRNYQVRLKLFSRNNVFLLDYLPR